MQSILIKEFEVENANMRLESSFAFLEDCWINFPYDVPIHRCLAMGLCLEDRAAAMWS